MKFPRLMSDLQARKSRRVERWTVHARVSTAAAWNEFAQRGRAGLAGRGGVRRRYLAMSAWCPWPQSLPTCTDSV
eukprot:3933173-Rhodomonas_salina.1